ncbi:S16 family serine protease [Pseudarthrobacter sp. J75]|uniref:YlbL family protein n=1 Tax=unclassified Pseudarthrobacter TaxID=2647000 RepID=UPI002E8222CD|nr:MULTISPECIES: S16 family serine protease [unclassified Pseudarthrobacter]MEE2521341.1 S16 family serine protease [Pseudarthrobacter sp. J47]MEE2528573.1 S16 family serine protease [Pseudarthrobacter sp. J75]
MTITRGDHPGGEPTEGTGGPGGHGRRRAASPAGPTHGNGPASVRDRGFAAMLMSGLVALVLGIAVGTLPVPYVVESPGPTFNTLATDGGSPVISVSGHESFPADGRLDLTTVYVDGGPNGPVSVLGAFSAWLDPNKAVYPEELIYPTEVTSEESEQESAAAMASSQENAVAAALNELRIPFEQQLQAAGFSDGSPSAGKLEEDDVFLSINGKDVTSLPVIQEELAAGAGAEATLVVERDGSPVTVAVTPVKNDAGNYVLGVLLKYRYTFPVSVTISLERVGGPSAGLMFALGIVDTITPGSLTGGKHIAGTGTITPEGKVGSIGGIGQKMIGAKASGATMFLAPAGNCDEAAGQIPAGLQVVRVETLKDARQAVEAAASGTGVENLPSCASN